MWTTKDQRTNLLHTAGRTQLTMLPEEINHETHATVCAYLQTLCIQGLRGSFKKSRSFNLTIKKGVKLESVALLRTPSKPMVQAFCGCEASVRWCWAKVIMLSAEEQVRSTLGLSGEYHAPVSQAWYSPGPREKQRTWVTRIAAGTWITANRSMQLTPTVPLQRPIGHTAQANQHRLTTGYPR